MVLCFYYSIIDVGLDRHNVWVNIDATKHLGTSSRVFWVLYIDCSNDIHEITSLSSWSRNDGRCLKKVNFSLVVSSLMMPSSLEIRSIRPAARATQRCSIILYSYVPTQRCGAILDGGRRRHQQQS